MFNFLGKLVDINVKLYRKTNDPLTGFSKIGESYYDHGYTRIAASECELLINQFLCDLIFSKHCCMWFVWILWP